MNKPSYLGHRKRIKEKYKTVGFNGWLDYEVLEFALSYAIARKDTKIIAKALISKFKTLNNVLDADRKELEQIAGISEHTALFLKFLKDISTLYLKAEMQDKDLLSNPEKVVNYLRASLKGESDESLKALFVNNKNHLLAVEVLQEGTIDRANIYPRKVVERALFHKATGVIIAHNHPSGSTSPSKEDIEATKAIKEALKTVEIRLLDHILVAEKGHYSFKEENLF